jgi:large subunit ribosomal protein L18
LEGDTVIASASSIELRKLGWNGSTANLPTAYLTGLLAGKRAMEQKIDTAVLDIGLSSPVKGSKIFASLRGMLDAGISIPHGEKIFPSEERISGKHISESIPAEFDKIKNKILSDFGKETAKKDKE